MSDLERIPDWMQPDTTSSTQLDLKAWAQDFRDVYQISEALSKTPFVPREMLGKQADVAAAIMKGRELGLDPFDALGSIYIVHGRVGYYAEFMRRRIIQAGHTLRIVENTDSRCVIEGVRKDGGEVQRASFTAEQARKAGIDLGKYPADKLVARATSRLCKQVFPDVLSGSLIAEDLIDGLAGGDDAAGSPEPVTAKPAVARKRVSKPVKAVATQPAPAPKADDADELAELLGDEAEPVENDKQAAMEADIAAIVAAVEPITALAEEPVDRSEEPAEPEPINAAQLKKMSILFRERGFDDTQRQDRLDLVKSIIGRDITSSKELTRAEASQVIDNLES